MRLGVRMAWGRRDQAMAITVELALSVKTVSTYRARVLEKTGMKTNAELTRYVVEQELAD